MHAYLPCVHVPMRVCVCTTYPEAKIEPAPLEIILNLGGDLLLHGAGRVDALAVLVGVVRGYTLAVTLAEERNFHYYETFLFIEEGHRILLRTQQDISCSKLEQPV